MARSGQQIVIANSFWSVAFGLHATGQGQYTRRSHDL